MQAAPVALAHLSNVNRAQRLDLARERGRCISWDGRILQKSLQSRHGIRARRGRDRAARPGAPECNLRMCTMSGYVRCRPEIVYVGSVLGQRDSGS